MPDEIKYCYALDLQTYAGSFDSRDAAASEAMAANPEGRSIFTAVIVLVDIRDISRGHGQQIIETIAETLSEMCGEAAELFDPDNDELKVFDNLVAVAIDLWVKGRGGVNCHTVAEVQRWEMPLEEIDS